MFAAASTRRRGRSRVDLCPFFRRVGMQRQRMEFAHHLAERAVDFLVTLDAVKPLELLADMTAELEPKGAAPAKKKP